MLRSRSRVPTEDNRTGIITPYGTVIGRGLRRLEAIRLDYKEPVKEETLRRQLMQYILRSPIVQVDGSGYGTYILEIPYTGTLLRTFIFW